MLLFFENPQSRILGIGTSNFLIFNILAPHFIVHYLLNEIAELDDGVLFNKSLDTFNMTAQELTKTLYDTYQPGTIWLVFVAIGLGATTLLFLYNRFILKE